ncbi:uncharacterized protein [Ciconia boyciana]|uniref:uncharacterized protein n=1 Tax=Ciconia boyciana TaxID=52775 RepID=UPI003BA2F92D
MPTNTRELITFLEKPALKCAAVREGSPRPSWVPRLQAGSPPGSVCAPARPGLPQPRRSGPAGSGAPPPPQPLPRRAAGSRGRPSSAGKGKAKAPRRAAAERGRGGAGGGGSSAGTAPHPAGTAPGRHRTPAGTAPRPARLGTARLGSDRLGSARHGTPAGGPRRSGAERPRPPRRSGRVDLHSRARWVSPMDLYHLLAAWTVTGSGMKCEERKLAARSPSVGRCCVCSAPAPARHPVRLSSKSLGLFASSYLAILLRGNYSSLARRVLIGELQASVVDSHVEAEPRVLCCAPRGEAACGKASSQPCISHFVTLRTRRWKACESRRGRTPPAGSYYKLDGVRALDTWFIPRRGMG